ncbi:MAG: bifunctional nuclease family protein [Bacteroidales bacterium]|jgi:bifunctional DNase/RNase|nr:bifunctional nuclease family protein [Bacteroidales bacterium]
MPLIEVFPEEIRRVSDSGSCLLMLTIPSNGRSIPVVIREPEAEAIILALQAVETERPMTHRLMCNIMHEYGLSVKEATIERFSEGIYYSSLTLSDGFNDKRIDSRTSDAITLALTAHAPIYATQNIIDETAVEPLLLDNPEDEKYSHQTLEQLEEKLQECLEKENYEQAAEIQAQIDKLKK